MAEDIFNDPLQVSQSLQVLCQTDGTATYYRYKQQLGGETNVPYSECQTPMNHYRPRCLTSCDRRLHGGNVTLRQN